MGYSFGIIVLLCSLLGCGELRVIRDAAMREIHAEAITVNWISDEGRKVESGNELFVNKHLRGNNFSSFRPDHVEAKKPIKGLWEQGSVQAGKFMPVAAGVDLK